jgi:peptide/nickel transport system permease protein
MVSVIVFVLMRMIPGDALVAKLGDSGVASEEDIAAFEAEHGLDDPLVVQYFRWLGQLLTGDLGESIYTGESIATSIKRAAPVSIQLGILGLLISVCVGIPLGLIAAIKRNSIWDNGLRLVSILGLSAPEFWTATMAITLMGIWFQWIPPLGRHVFWEDPVGTMIQLSIPALIIGYRLSAVVARMTRSAVLDVVRDDYIRTANAKGLQPRIVIFRHVLRNALLPVLTILGAQMIVVIGGTVIIETIFGLPGMGRLMLNAINFRDYPLVQVLVFLIAVMVVTINILVDLSYGLIDPRVRYA